MKIFRFNFIFEGCFLYYSYLVRLGNFTIWAPAPKSEGQLPISDYGTGAFTFCDRLHITLLKVHSRENKVEKYIYIFIYAFVFVGSPH